MKKTQLCIYGILLTVSMAACNGNTGTGGTSDSTKMNPGDSSVTTTTTITTVHRRYSGTFVPQPNVKYIDLRTHKQVTVRIDTVRGEVVNSETDEPMDLFVAPNSTDTFYGQTGTIANNYISVDEGGNYKVDTARISPAEVQTVTPPPMPDDAATTSGKYKEKDDGNKKKLKTTDEKVKERNGIIKEKSR